MPYALPREDPKIIIRKVIKTFEITEEIFRKIQSHEGNYEIQVRCLKFDGKGYNNIWPNAGGVILNDVTILETQKVLAKNPLPLNISEKVSFGTNTISVLKYNDSQYYVASVMLVKKLNFNEIYNKFTNDLKIISEDEGKQFIIDILHGGTSKISVKCPLTNRIIDEPFRGINCRHIQWFDLIRWLQLQGNPSLER